MSIKKIWCGVVLLVCLFPAIALAERDVNEYEYVILAGKTVREDAGWNKVIEVLKKRHDAFVIPFESWPEEALPALKKANPRYVAVVEKAENITAEYIKMMHKIKLLGTYIQLYRESTPSRLRRTPSINRGRVEILPVFGKSHQLLLCL